jgi:allophanate hydrolase
MAGERYSAVDTFRAQYELETLSALAEPTWRDIDVLLLPTAPSLYKIEDDARDGRTYNDRHGHYTRFVNFLGYPALSIPAGFKPEGLPFGVTLVMPRGCDRELDGLGAALERKLNVGMGKWRTPVPVPAASTLTPSAALGYVRLAVVGAHLRGQPLNVQLLEARARFVRQTRTAAQYKLFALPNTTPPKPGMVRVETGGAPIEVELWDVPTSTYGTFVARVPSPLCIGTLRCEDGEVVQGFLCETLATEGAEDITRFGGFRAYLSR